jgi:NADH-quinone oxidoreductase subunit M
MPLDWPILSTLIWLPVAGGRAAVAARRRARGFGRWLALLASVVAFVLSVVLWNDFDRGTAAMQFVEREPWIGAFNAGTTSASMASRCR